MKTVVKYTTNEAAIAKMSDIYMKLTIKGIEDTEGFEAVHSAEMIMVKHRTSIDKFRKSTNKDAQEFISTNNKNAKKLTDLIEPIETHLKNEKAKITKEKERIQAEEERLEKIKINDRVTALFDVGANIPYFEAAMLSDEEYETMLDETTNKHNTERLRLQEEQKAREEIRKRLAEAQKAQESEAKRLADIQAAQDKKEAELKAQAKAIEDEKKAEAERKKREEFEKQAKEDARIQAEKDAKKKAEEERRKQRKKTEESRRKLLSAVGFSISRNDLGTMPNDQFDRMYSEVKAKWDKEQAKLISEKLEKDHIESEKKRIANEKADREAKEQETKEARLESLQEIGFKYPFNDLGIMPDKQYAELYGSHRKVWDAKQQALLVEKLERERAEREYVEATEKARVEALRPDREKLVNWIKSFNGTNNPRPDLKSKEAKKILNGAIEYLEVTLQKISEKIMEEL